MGLGGCHTCVRRGPMQDAVSDAVACASDAARLSSIHGDAARFMPNQLRFTLNRADSARIGPYRVISDGNRYG